MGSRYSPGAGRHRARVDGGGWRRGGAGNACHAELRAHEAGGQPERGDEPAAVGAELRAQLGRAEQRAGHVVPVGRMGSLASQSAAAAGVGWLVFYQPGGRVVTQPAAAPLLHTFTLPEDVSVHGSRAAVTFWPVARAGTTSTFDLCGIGSGASMAGRAVVVSQTGRSRVATEEAACAP